MKSVVKSIGIGLIIGSGLLSGSADESNNPQHISPPEDTLKSEIIVGDTNRYNRVIDEETSFVYSPTALKRYNHWVDSTLAESAQDSTNSIMAVKSDYSIYLIKNGKIDSQYNIELGFNPYDDKQKEGDGCTPEGMYLVQRKLPKGSTSFYKAFLINYPTEEQRLAGKTGGLIEIHGSGSGNKGNENGYNWTLGCMALSNNDIDKIFPYIEEGDRITIVRHTTRDLD